VTENHEAAAPPPRFFQTPRGRLLLRLAVAGLAAFVLGFLFTAIVLFGGRGGDDVVTVPDLRWQPEAEARRLASQSNLTLELGNTLVNPEVPAGNVLAQSPLPGEEVSPGSAVRVTLSSGAERRTVPEVSGLSGEQARQLLTRFGFEVEVEERTDPAPMGRVLEMTPQSGARVEMPATVRLVVSSGPPRAPVPNVAGMSVEDARTAIGNAGFYVAEVEYDFFSLSPPGTVVSQAPAAGVEVRLGAGIRLTVSGAESGNQ
jgi:eukaryotic-like serine/threonine-protein kinase